MDKFEDIRPYQDHEIRSVLDKLITNPEFLSSIATFYFPRLTGLLPNLMASAARNKLKKQLKAVHNVKTMQDVIAEYMDKMIHDTTTKLTHSGLENLDADKGYLFVSNHRDITMDPAFVNYVLYHAGYETLQIAVGDNLLKKPFVTDLMRLNKSFIVKRSLKGRELLRSLSLLSEYIHYCIKSKSNVWIAQSEGRAKDGIDKTDPALLKMLSMANRRLSLGGSLKELHIVPVVISYEYDACDVLKAEELYTVENTGRFLKTDRSDIHSIVTGMIGFKGRVDVTFGKELQINNDDPEEIAAAIDHQILENYKLHDINFLALERLRQDGLISPNQLSGQIPKRNISNVSYNKFKKRFESINPKLHKHFLFSYANPLLIKHQT